MTFDDHDLRPGEIALPFNPAERPADAGLVFIGRIRTPWQRRVDCPRNGKGNRTLCTVEVDADYRPGLRSVETCSHLYLLYWMHQARRDLIVQTPAFAGVAHGCFALRTPVRPNPVALSVVELVDVRADGLVVRGLDCLDNTPLLDIKPYFAGTDSVPEARVGWREDLDRKANTETDRDEP